MNAQRAATLLLSLGLAAPALAGGEGGKDGKAEYRCTMDTQACLDAMATKLTNRGWVGIEWDMGATNAITRIVPGSPAERDGLQVGDVIRAQDGISFTDENWEQLKKAHAGFVPGKVVTYTVEREGVSREVAITLGELPREVLAMWVGNHMLEHANTERLAASK